MKKIIHYCWFGGKPLSELTLKCIESWKKYLPEFEIKQWNESNFDVNQSEFIKQAYEQKKWAFVSDYARFKVLKDYGGLYLDTDMEMKKEIKVFLENDLFFGVEDSKMINAAIVWSKEKENKHISNIFNIYNSTQTFNSTGDLFDQSVPKVITKYFEDLGYDKNKDETQILDNVSIYRRDYFYPLSYDYQNNEFTENTVAIHHFGATWTSKSERIKTWFKRKNLKFVVNIIDFLFSIKRTFTPKDILILLIPMSIFLIALLSFWPGINTYDGNYQWNQIQNNYITDAHPFFSTYIVKILSNLWNSKTIVMIFQILVFSFIWMFICKAIRGKDGKILNQVIYTVIICSMPIIFIYAITFWKDVLFSYFLLVLTLMFYIGIKNDFKYRNLNMFVIAILIVLIQAYRHNGIIVSMITIAFVIFLMIKKKVKKSGIIVFFSSLIIFYLLIQIPKLLIVKPSEDILDAKQGLVLYMTGALLDNNVAFEKEEIEYLNKLIPVEKWKELYDPYLINPIIHSDILNRKELENSYDKLKVIFAKNAIKHPFIMAKHLIRVSSLIWSPIPFGYTYIFDFSDWGPEFYGFNDKVETKFQEGKNVLDGVVNFTMKNKYLRNIIYRPATAMYASIIVVIYLCKKTKDKKYYYTLIPMLANSLSYLPVSLAQDLRYVYINYLYLAFSVLMAYTEIKRNNKEKE